MTTTNRKSEHDMIPLYRVQLKANNIVIWSIRSESGHDYRVTIFEGKVSSCEQEDGSPCRGWRYRKQGKTCHHATLALQREAARKEAMRTVEPQEQEPLETSQKGSLNGSSQGFSLMR